MCRLLGYLGSPIQLDQLLYKPEHSLITQSYHPREMTAGLLNADGFGIGWYHPDKETYPYSYKNTLPIWSDINLPHLSRYAESGCFVSYVRSATPPLAVDLTNCQPFAHDRLLFVHNGYVENFRQTLYRPIRKTLSDPVYQQIHGNTDSEHIFAAILNEIHLDPQISLKTALNRTLTHLTQLANDHNVHFSANIILSNGKQLVASRYSHEAPTPTLYWLRDDPLYPDGVILASEPLFRGNWNSCPKNHLVSVEENLEITIHSIP